MAQKQLSISLAAALLIVLWVCASAQSSNGCTSAIVSLSPCLNYITDKESAPSYSCCTQLASVVQSEPQCLCTVLNGGASAIGITIDQARALALPGACRVQTPPVSLCKSNGGSPLTPFQQSPSSPSEPSTPSVQSTPTGGVSELLPTDSSDGNFAQIPFSLIISLLFLAAY